MMPLDKQYQSIQWKGDHLILLDQTRLPSDEVYLHLSTEKEVWEAIRQLKVRGAPAIGIAGAYGLFLGIRNLQEEDRGEFLRDCEDVADYLNSSRPTAVNLSWALNKILKQIKIRSEESIEELKKQVLRLAIEIHEEDRELCRQIGLNGVELVPPQARILTHCNTGGLATGQYGTALSVIFHAHQKGNVEQVWVDETRPLLQGARLTTWELQKAGVPFSLNIDSAAGFLMQQKKVDMVIIGADRISANGDSANKIGSYGLAVLANAHDIPFYVAAPYSTIDLDLPTGDLIEIEQRDPSEVTHFGSASTTPEGIDVYNPAFDIVPNYLITAIITERGIIRPDYSKHLGQFAMAASS